MLLIVGAGSARAQTDQLAEEERLEREFTNPLTTLPQLLIRDSYSPATFGPCNLLACPRNAQTNQIIIRPLFPRIPSNTLLPFMQLVRPTFSLVTVPSPRGGVRTEFGDLPLFDIAVLPWPDRQKTGLLVGVGLSLVFPTATSKSAGQGAWQSGPRAGRSLPGDSWLTGRLHRTESDFFRIHLAQTGSPEHVDRSARHGTSPVREVVSTIR